VLQDSPPDGVLIEAVLSGKSERFAALVRRYEQPLLYVAAGRLGRDDWAEDVVQETFLSAYKSLHTYDSQYSFRTWLWTILLNQCRRHLRKVGRTPRVFAWSDAPATDADSAGAEWRQRATSEPAPSAALMVEERRQQLEEMLSQVPVAQADALRLRFFGQLKFAEIGAALGCTESAAKQRVRIGLIKLGQMVEEEAWSGEV